MIGVRSIDLGCEFCAELERFEMSRYAEVYGVESGKRIVYSKGMFLVMPTIGQIFFGHSLVLTRNHFCSFAEVPGKRLGALNDVIARTENALRPLGRTVLFEHGTTPQVGGGCGIYHAHIHVIPTPGHVPPEFLLPEGYEMKNSMADALCVARQGTQYLLYRDMNGRFFVSYPGGKIQSQYFRKKIVDYFSLRCSWNWRDCGFEARLAEAIVFLKSRGFSKG